MKIDRKYVLGISEIYNLKNGFYAIDLYISRGNMVVRVEYPLQNLSAAKQMNEFLSGRTENQPLPGYCPSVWMLNIKPEKLK